MKKKIYYWACGIFLSLLVVFTVVVGAYKVAYPYKYYAQIERYATEYSVDKYLVLALIKTESGYNENAVSKKGAVGLMQIMPTTAEFIAQKLGDKDFKAEKLFEPTLNIRYGIYYLSYLFARFETEEQVLFAYNAGEGTLKTSLSENSFEQTLNDYQSVKSYLEKIEKDKKAYKFVVNISARY